MWSSLKSSTVSVCRFLTRKYSECSISWLNIKHVEVVTHHIFKYTVNSPLFCSPRILYDFCFVPMFPLQNMPCSLEAPALETLEYNMKAKSIQVSADYTLTLPQSLTLLLTQRTMGMPRGFPRRHIPINQRALGNSARALLKRLGTSQDYTHIQDW
jgi:hypothetical protein